MIDIRILYKNETRDRRRNGFNATRVKRDQFIAVIDCVTRALRPSFTPFSINDITEVAQQPAGRTIKFLRPELEVQNVYAQRLFSVANTAAGDVMNTPRFAELFIF